MKTQRGVAAALLILIVLGNCTDTTFAWWDTGHVVVGQIASNWLEKESVEVKKAIDNALASLLTYSSESSTFITSACWMDDLKTRGIQQFDNWHFINIPICDNNITICEAISVTDVLSSDDNIVWAITESIATIKNKIAGGFERGFAFRNLLHLVGDIHQPLHATNRFSTETPDGDRGGNSFSVKGISGIHNLHALWDSTAGLLDNSLNRPYSANNLSYIKIWAEKIIANTNTTGMDVHNVTAWAMDSIALARQYVYNLPFGSVPSADYIATAHQIIMQQLAIAGYRLAQLLKQIVLCDHSSDNCPVLPASSVGSSDSPLKVEYISIFAVLGGLLLVSAITNGVFVYKRKQDKWKKVAYDEVGLVKT